MPPSGTTSLSLQQRATGSSNFGKDRRITLTSLVQMLMDAHEKDRASKKKWREFTIRNSKFKRHYFIRSIEFHPLMAVISAAVEIQRVVKGFLTRRGFYKKKIFEMAALREHLVETRNHERAQAYEKAHQALVTHNAARNEENLTHFLTSYIPILQAKFHQLVSCWKYNANERFKNRIVHIAASLIQIRYRAYRQRLFRQTGSREIFFVKYKMFYYDKKSHAAFIIQKWWRNCINRQIFKFYKQLILFKERSHPLDILKGINPSEACLIDTAVGAFIRFRLGGSLYPPSIFYKVFLNKPIIDINAFAPRNYAMERKDDELSNKVNVASFSNHRDVLKQEWEFEDWYHREEKNSWRAIAANTLIPEDMLDDPNFQDSVNRVILERARKEVRYCKGRYSSNVSKNSTFRVIQMAKNEQDAVDKLLPFHYAPARRKLNTQMKKRKTRLEWLIKMRKTQMLKEKPEDVIEDMTADNHVEETEEDDDPPEDEIIEEIIIEPTSTSRPNVRSDHSDLRELALSIRERDLLDELEEIALFGEVEEIDEEMTELLQWCDNLDHYKYVEDWQLMATTLSSDQPRRPKKKQTESKHSFSSMVKTIVDQSQTTSKANSELVERPTPIKPPLQGNHSPRMAQREADVTMPTTTIPSISIPQMQSVTSSQVSSRLQSLERQKTTLSEEYPTTE